METHRGQLRNSACLSYTAPMRGGSLSPASPGSLCRGVRLQGRGVVDSSAYSVNIWTEQAADDTICHALAKGEPFTSIHTQTRGRPCHSPEPDPGKALQSHGAEALESLTWPRMSVPAAHIHSGLHPLPALGDWTPQWAAALTCTTSTDPPGPGLHIKF